MHFLCANGAQTIADAQNGWQKAHEIASASAPDFAAALQGTTRSDTVSTPAEGPLASYFGGSDSKPLAIVASHWVSDAGVSAFRAYDTAIFASGLFDPQFSFYLVTREVEIFSV